MMAGFLGTMLASSLQSNDEDIPSGVVVGLGATIGLGILSARFHSPAFSPINDDMSAECREQWELGFAKEMRSRSLRSAIWGGMSGTMLGATTFVLAEGTESSRFSKE
jgi:hypothetical protein